MACPSTTSCFAAGFSGLGTDAPAPLYTLVEHWNGSGYPDGPVAFFQYIAKWRESGEFEGLEFTPAPDAAPGAVPTSTEGSEASN